MKRWTALCLILLITAFIGAGVCIYAGSIMKNGTAESENGEELIIATSFYPVYIMALNLTDNIEGISLVNLADQHVGCLHDYQLTTGNMKLLEKSSLFIINGGGMEGFLGEVAAQCENLEIISCDGAFEDGVEADSAGNAHDEGVDWSAGNVHDEDGDWSAGNAHDEDGHEHGENAHYWMDPVLYIKMVKYLSGQLSVWDPEHKAVYEENERIYCGKLEGLVNAMESDLSNLAGVNIISFHEAFYYLARRSEANTVYTLDLDGEVYLGAGEVSQVLDKIKEENVGFLWMEQDVEQNFSDLVSSGNDAKIVILDSLTSGAVDKDAYIEGMEKNIEALKNSLQ